MDWFSYGPADLVPFSRGAWLTLLGRYNQEGFGWVAAGLATVLAVGLLSRLALGPTPSASRTIQRLLPALFGLCWLWIGWAFFHQALGTLLWAADWLAWGFAAQGLALLVAALLPLRDDATATGWRAAAGWGLLLVALIGLPLLAWATGQPWRSIGWFGGAPDPTAVATLGLLLVLPVRLGWLLLPLPLIWCLLASVLGRVLGDPLWPLPLFCGVATLLGWGLGRFSARGDGNAGVSDRST
jgi:hypothetical protein